MWFNIIIVLMQNLGANIGNPYFIPKWSAFLKMPGPSHQPCGINLTSKQISLVSLELLFGWLESIISQDSINWKHHLDEAKPVELGHEVGFQLVHAPPLLRLGGGLGEYLLSLL